MFSSSFCTCSHYFLHLQVSGFLFHIIFTFFFTFCIWIQIILVLHFLFVSRHFLFTKSSFFTKKGACGNVPTLKSSFSPKKAPAATLQDKNAFFRKKRRLRQHSRTRKLFFKTEKQNRFRFRQVGGWVWTLPPRGKIKQ